jgi:hypothetical protein
MSDETKTGGDFTTSTVMPGAAPEETKPKTETPVDTGADDSKGMLGRIKKLTAQKAELVEQNQRLLDNQKVIEEAAKSEQQKLLDAAVEERIAPINTKLSEHDTFFETESAKMLETVPENDRPEFSATMSPMDKFKAAKAIASAWAEKGNAAPANIGQTVNPDTPGAKKVYGKIEFDRLCADTAWFKANRELVDEVLADRKNRIDYTK